MCFLVFCICFPNHNYIEFYFIILLIFKKLLGRLFAISVSIILDWPVSILKNIIVHVFFSTTFLIWDWHTYFERLKLEPFLIARSNFNSIFRWQEIFFIYNDLKPDFLKELFDNYLNLLRIKPFFRIYGYKHVILLPCFFYAQKNMLNDFSVIEAFDA